MGPYLCPFSLEYILVHSRRRRGGRGGGRPPIRFKTSKIRANGLFIWANSLDIWAHHCQNTVSDSVKTFFFFGEHLHLDRKTVQISGKTFFFFGEHLNLGGKNRLNFDRETQCIKSFFGQKFAAPPNHFELLQPCFSVHNATFLTETSDEDFAHVESALKSIVLLLGFLSQF